MTRSSQRTGQALIDLASRLAAAGEMSAVRHAIVDEVGTIIPARAWGIYELDETGKPINIEASAGVPVWFLDDYEAGGRPTDPIYSGICRMRTPVDSGRFLHWRRWRAEPVYEILDRVGFQRSLQAPIVVDGSVRGTLNVARHKDDPPFAAADLAHLETLSAITSRVFERITADEANRSVREIASIALDSVTEPIVVTDTAGTPFVVNDAAQRMAGPTGEQLLASCLAVIRDNLTKLRVCGRRSIETVVEDAMERLTVQTMLVVSVDGCVAVSHVYRRNTSVGAPPLDHSPLTPRQREIVAMVGAGMTVSEIAESVYVSPNTVKQHLKRIYGKLGVHSRAELVQVLWESSDFNRGAN